MKIVKITKISYFALKNITCTTVDIDVQYKINKKIKTDIWGMEMANIEDVAKLAGVSPATVSRVANGSYRVNTEKYSRVIEAMLKLGYKPRERIALSNNITEMTTVQAEKQDGYRVIVFAYMSTNETSELLPTLERAARAHGMNLTYKFVMSRKDIDDMDDVIQGYDGSILCDFDISEDEYMRISKLKPVVSCRKQYGFPGTVTVSIDDEQAGYDAAAYLISKGCRRILFVGHDMYRSKQPTVSDLYRSMHQYKRYFGYARACIMSGFEVLQPVVLPTFPADGTDELSETWFEYFDDPNKYPDAVICQYVSDVWVVRDITSKYGFSIPGDILPFSFVDSPNTQRMDIPVITQQLEVLADITVRTLKFMIDGVLPRGEQLSIYTAHSLIAD